MIKLKQSLKIPVGWGFAPRVNLLLILLFAVGFVCSQCTAKIEPAPATYVADRAGIIDNTIEYQLIGLLQELEQKTTARIIVLTVNSTDGQDIAQFAFERADVWKFGANRKSASVLVVVAAKDRKYRIETGYDWEGVLPDGYVGDLGRKYMVPNFKAGDYGQGILQAVAVMSQKIADEKGVTLTGMPEIRSSQPTRRRPLLPCGGGLLPLLIIFSLMSGRRHRGMLFWGLLAGSMMGGRGSSGGFGGGGGGFGSFGGGGGGGFGGGGAGGSW